MVKVRATDKFVKERVADATTGKVRLQGEEWEVNEDRANLLIGRGFCVRVEEPHAVEELAEVKAEPKKRGRKKKA